MRYRWDAFCLDPERMLLTRQGQAVEASRKTLQCIRHLIENRDRVVGFDELTEVIWGHEGVTNHQLSQVILTSRRTIGDDGHTQRLIRTSQGLGYRWIGPVAASEERPDNAPGISAHGDPTADRLTASPLQASSDPPAVADRTDHPRSLPPVPDADAANAPETPERPRMDGPRHPVTRSRARIALLLALFALSAIGLRLHVRLNGSTSESSPVAPADPIRPLRASLIAGDFEGVREGIANLPDSLVDTPEARLLEIELDIKRGRFERATARIEAQLDRTETATDPVLRARILILDTTAGILMGGDPVESLASAEDALSALDAAGDDAPPALRAEALERHARALIENDRLEDALRDLRTASDLFAGESDSLASIAVKTTTARALMRMGRLDEALASARDAAESYAESSARTEEIYARNTLSRIQMELMRWDEARQSNDRSMQLLREIPDAERRYRTLQLRALILSHQGRLRLAASQLEEAAELAREQPQTIIPALYYLEAGRPEDALKASTEAFENDNNGDRFDILLDSKDGALLLWITAAQALTGDAAAMPIPSPAQEKRLRSPTTTLAMIARGRWLWSQGRRPEAEAELRRALNEARRMNQRYRMTLATEPLVELLLQEERVEEARIAMQDLLADDPERMRRDFRIALLRLKIAVAMKDDVAAARAYTEAMRLAGERRPPTMASGLASASSR